FLHELFQFCKLYDLFIKSVDLLNAKTKHGAVHVYILSAGELRIEPDAQFNKWHQLSVDINTSFGWLINSCDDLEQGALTATVATHDAKEFTLLNLKIYVYKSVLNFPGLTRTILVKSRQQTFK